MFDYSKCKPLTTGDVGKLLHVHHRTALDWVRTGKLKGYRTPGRHCRIEVLEFMEFCHKYKFPINGNKLFWIRRMKKPEAE